MNILDIETGNNAHQLEMSPRRRGKRGKNMTEVEKFYRRTIMVLLCAFLVTVFANDYGARTLKDELESLKSQPAIEQVQIERVSSTVWVVNATVTGVGGREKLTPVIEFSTPHELNVVTKERTEWSEFVDIRRFTWTLNSLDKEAGDDDFSPLLRVSVVTTEKEVRSPFFSMNCGHN